MKINKKVLGNLERVYATNIMNIDNEYNYLIATEGKGSCLRFDENYNKSIVWDNPGGTMNIIPVPNKEKEFIATQNFFPTFDAKESRIVHAVLQYDKTWKITPIMKIPYLHRFDIIDVNGEIYFIGSTLCEGKEFKDDWTKPGKVYIGKLNDNITEPFDIKPILEGITKNHGFCNGIWNGKRTILVSGSEGVFAIYVPENGDGEWKTEQLLSHEVSDIATCDIDNDGVMELATIEAFHGDKGIIYKKVDGKLKPIYSYSYEFGHVIWGGKILNEPAFIIGGRKGKMELMCFKMDKTGNINSTLIDNTGGPSNISVVNMDDKDVILAANRQVGEIAVYELTK
ncbi:hypothetical protein SH1V18_23500 [Vallitalea longa]|uniref:Uncharacterized protein n=1 Tax=Vallitalea longa TaxID=2936439 RepID=A0A9W5YC36_9FIRM|nr:hypothetical protein [Vallitalea longa]GKX29870.1 hypothetical protein SH1V18_23500 [Vallitalea longa]